MSSSEHWMEQALYDIDTAKSLLESNRLNTIQPTKNDSERPIQMLQRMCVIVSVTLLFGLLAVMSGCGDAFDPPPPTPTAEEYCASFPSVGFGNFFYCGTNQGNLQVVNFPDGAHGFCQTANTNNIGLVGYSAYTFNGGASPVQSQSDASALCNLLGNQCAGYIRCTRL